MNKKWIAATAIYIGLIAVCCIALYAVPSVRGMLERTYIAEYGTIDVTDEVSAFIVRDETVYVAAQSSFINRLAEPDKLVKAGTRVVELTPDDETIEAENTASATRERTLEEAGVVKDESKKEAEKAETPDTGKYASLMAELGDAVRSTEDGSNAEAGYVSYYIDGAEALLSTEAMADLKQKDYKSLSGKRAVEVPSDKCRKGYPVYKIVRNSKWYLVYYLSKDDAAKYTAGDTVTAELGGEPVSVTVSQVLDGKTTSRITLSCKSFFDGFLEERNLDTKITVASASGLVLEDASIVEAPDGRRGVFTVNKLGEHVFKPIRAKADDGRKCVVFSDIYVDEGGNYVETIGTYDEIVAEPTEEDMASLAPAEKAPEAEAGAADGNAQDGESDGN